MDYIKGYFKHTIYQNESFIIGRFKIKETSEGELTDYTNRSLTFKGYFDSLNYNDLYTFYGHLENNEKYGVEFIVESYERLKPESKDGIVKFLSSPLFKGIGEAIAKRIVHKLGENALDKILEDKRVLDKVPKLSMKKIDTIYETLTEYEEGHKVIVKLNNLGFNMNDSIAIYNYYKNNTLMILEHNPYQIINDLDQINFPKLDEISSNLGITPTDTRRIEACIIYLMKELSFENGDTYSLYEEIARSLNKYNNLEIESSLVLECLENLASDLKIVIEDDKYYLADIYDDEVFIAKRIKYLAQKKNDRIDNIDDYIDKLEKRNNITYNDIQKEAIRESINNHLLVITGGPGVGKTTIIKAIIELYRDLYKLSSDDLMEYLVLLSPTGRASKRMMMTTNFKAQTIHRFLKWNKDDNSFGVNEYKKDYHKLIIIDEVSMIDNYLMSSLLKGLKKDIKLIMVGDYNQLPSVGAGNVLKDIIDSGCVKTVSLTRLYRQKTDSYIPVLANEIKDNNLSNFLVSRDDYRFVKCQSKDIIRNLVSICSVAKRKGYDYKRIQIMAPMYASLNGIDNLNRIIQDIFNPQDGFKNELKYGDVIYRENDKVLQLVNIPDENVYNGDIGTILKINESYESESGKREMIIDFDGNKVTYDYQNFNDIKHGYVMSIHKSQGSEFELVIIPVCKSYSRMLYRKLIYTGITRAKRKLIMIGDDEAFIEAVNNEREKVRKTDLLKKLYKNF